MAERLGRELEELKKLPPKRFVRHYAIRRSEDGLWYRISEWVDALNWGELMRSGRLRDGHTILCYVPESGRFSAAFMLLTVCLEH